MSINTYYRDELSYLREKGGEFARANPRLSQYLSRDGSDPDVERLFEGFAFLVGRLRMQIDAEMPELAHNLLQLIWPHYLKPVPPITTLQLGFADGASGASIKVPRNTGVQTGTIDGEAVSFRTSYDTTVLPFRIDDLQLENRTSSCTISIRFQRLAGAGLQGLGEGPVRLFFNSNRNLAVAQGLFALFHEKMAQATFAAKGEPAQKVKLGVSSCGFEDEQATLPYPQGSFRGFRIMQEYFSCPEKFLYVELDGLQRFAGSPADSFTLTFEFSQRFGVSSKLDDDQIVINCTPAVNLFETEGQALLVSHDRSEYPVRMIGDRDKFSIHTISDLVGWVQGTGERVDYELFESFRHDPATSDGGEKLYYRTKVRPSMVGLGIDHFVSFVSRYNKLGIPPTETVSLRLICSNGKFATRFGIGSVNQPTSTTPNKLKFSNITPIMSEVMPPLDDSVLFTLIANLARNFASLIDVEALKTVIRAYDFRSHVDKQAAQQLELLLQSLDSFERKSIDIVRKGRPVRAYELTLSLSEMQMGGEGEMYLFGRVLDHFLRSYASVNSLHRFTIVGKDMNVRYRFQPEWGEANTL
ncbi:type VI secretion system baseplate subunit TssF [uncultured Cohaesibacter sp.]|uniref:type VI secretion system baseplate subunit TssF n=1 Tax=uncultured Cohaesibacter sp. TaxID=1002546 RepID=UPI0029C9222C|nr:type VI secretion system baseplate subunit TssF [uncultured Cohaesibacter sp.]